MRLPYLQVTQETWTSAKMLSRVLGVGRHEAFGLVCDLWAWALELGPDDRAPDGVCLDPDAAELMAGALEWAGDSEKLLAAFVRLDLIQKLEIGLRVRGLDRYASTWEKRKKDRTRKFGGIPAVSTGSRADSVGIPSEVARSSSGIPGGSQGKTQTQTHIEAKALSANLPTGEESEKPDSPARQVFDHWRTAMGKTLGAKLDAKRTRLVKARLSDGYSVDDLKRAVDGCKATPHNMGVNDRGEKFNSLDLICRDAEHVDRFMSNAGAPPVGTAAPPKPKWKPNPTPAGFWDQPTVTE